MTCDDSQPSSDKVNCLDAVEDLYTYLDGEIDDEKRAKIRAHLEECSPCLEAFDFEDDLKRLIGDGCKSEMPSGLRDKVLAAINDLTEQSG